MSQEEKNKKKEEEEESSEESSASSDDDEEEEGEKVEKKEVVVVIEEKKKEEEEEEEEDDDDETEEEEEEEEEEESDGEESLLIKGDYNFEIPEVLHVVFKFLTAKEIVEIGAVSKAYRAVATSDLLWGHILEKKSRYIEEGKLLSGKLAFFYDLKPKGDDLYTKFLYKFKRAHLRNKRIERRKKQIEFQDELERRSEPYCLILFTILMGLTSILVPPIGLCFTYLAGSYKLKDQDFEEPVITKILKTSSLIDLLLGMWCTLGGLPSACYCLLSCCSCCFCCGCCFLECAPCAMLYSCFCCLITAPNIGVFALAGWLGRFYFADRMSEPEIALLAGSPAILLGYAAVGGIYAAGAGIIALFD